MKADLTLTSMAIAVFAERTERDKQRLIGASNFSNPCDRCVADDLAGVEHEPNATWLPAVVGTAVHSLAEERLTKSESLREMFHHPKTEEKLELGEIKGYGMIKSTTDLYIPEMNICWDWKTTTRDKLRVYDTLFGLELEVPEDVYSDAKYNELRRHLKTIEGYVYQLHAYGKGCVDAGLQVDSLAIGFVCRDGKDENDIKVFKVNYDPNLAQQVWDRVNLIWAYIQDGTGLDSFSSHPYCWYCNNQR